MLIFGIRNFNFFFLSRGLLNNFFLPLFFLFIDQCVYLIYIKVIDNINLIKLLGDIILIIVEGRRYKYKTSDNFWLVLSEISIIRFYYQHNNAQICTIDLSIIYTK